MRLAFGILGLVLYALLGVAGSYLNSPLWRTVLFILSIIPVTLMTFLFVDNLNELKDAKKFASFVTLLIFLTLIGSLYHGTATKENLTELLLFGFFVWILIPLSKTRL
ncbi:hypothetical protein [Thermococcus sp.]|uniref:hypothetical protein n=1 Tax=Thermococcus sp. TaxID=35749 RepID=UPI002603833D|nr:hypothetical protein [Thermococcus sp.]